MLGYFVCHLLILLSENFEALSSYTRSKILLILIDRVTPQASDISKFTMLFNSVRVVFNGTSLA